jgi:hypothetical protein
MLQQCIDNKGKAAHNIKPNIQKPAKNLPH